MTYQDFIDRYMLSFTYKVAKDQSNNPTSSHVNYRIKIKSVILSGKLKVIFNINPNFHKLDHRSLLDILECIQSDLDLVRMESRNDFIENSYPDDALKGLEVWNNIQKLSQDCRKFFGEGGLQDLFECV